MFKLFSREIDQKQKIEQFGGFLMLALAAVYAFICSPVNIFSYSNILISNSAFPIFWDFINDAVQYLYLWIAFAFVIYFSTKYSIKECWKLLTFFTSCSLGRYLFSLLISLAINNDWEVFGYEFKYVLIDVLSDLLMMGAVILLIYLTVVRNTKQGTRIESVQYVSLLQISNPLIRCILASAFVPALLRVVARIFYDLFLGAPQGKADLISMIVYYTGDILCGVIGYLVIFLLVSQLKLKDEEARQRD